MKAYRIKDWNLHFENSKSRERDLCSWCPMPNKQDGLGYGRLLSMKDGAAMYGAFIAVVLVASKQRKPRDGHLTDTGRADGCPLTADDLSIMSKVPAVAIDKMLEAVSCATIGWIECYESGYTSARQVPAKCPPATPLLKEGNEGNERKEVKKPYGELQRVLLFDAEYQLLKDKHGEENLRRGIEILDGYIASKNKKYASHYAVMKEDSWVWERLAQASGPRPRPAGNRTTVYPSVL